MLEHILKEAVRQNASDVHIKAGGVPVFRINGVLNRQNLPAVSENAIISFIEQYGTCAVNETEADFCCRINCAGSFRVHGYLQNGFPALAVRIIKSAVPSLSDLNAPPVLGKLAMQRSGLILVTGRPEAAKAQPWRLWLILLTVIKVSILLLWKTRRNTGLRKIKVLSASGRLAVIPLVLHLACVRHCARTLTLL